MATGSTEDKMKRPKEKRYIKESRDTVDTDMKGVFMAVS
jgi:hypothetical protein